VTAQAQAPAPQAPAQGRGGGRGGAPAAPAAPTPRRADGKPILGSVPGQPVGGWGAGVTTLPRGEALDEVPFQPWARAVYDLRQIDQFEPHTRCKASGVSRQFSTPYGTEFVEVPDLQRMYIMDNGGPNSYRIIYLDGRSFPQNIPPTNYGYSIGHWEGDTLVVDTTNYTPKTHFVGSSEKMHVVERFAKVDAQTIKYTATVDDPETWPRPWTMELPFRTTKERIYEYACHEGNRAIENFLRGARAEEKRNR